MKAQQEIKDLAKKVQKVSKEMGYEMKLNHALEIVSRTHFNQTWHVVKNRNDLSSISIPNEESNINEYQLFIKKIINEIKFKEKSFDKKLTIFFRSLNLKNIIYLKDSNKDLVFQSNTHILNFDDSRRYHIYYFKNNSLTLDAISIIENSLVGEDKALIFSNLNNFNFNDLYNKKIDFIDSNNINFNSKTNKKVYQLEDILHIIKNDFFIESKEDNIINTYLNKLEENKFKNKIVYGFNSSNNYLFEVNPIRQPGAFITGMMGSGKTTAMKFSLTSHIANNSENTVYFMIDTLKGMNFEYSEFFKTKYKKNIIPALNSIEKFIQTIDIIHREAMERKEKFSSTMSKNIDEYNQLENKKLSKIMVIMEEFHAVVNDKKVDYRRNENVIGSTANKLKELMRTGRSYGINFMVSSQRATAEDFPTSLKPGLSTMISFKPFPGMASALNLPHADEITEYGTAAYHDGFIKPLFLTDKAIHFILNRYYKPLNTNNLTFKIKEIQDKLK